MAEQQSKAPAELKKVAAYLHSGSAGIKTRVGALNGKRMDYFKGKAAIKSLLSPSYAKKTKLPPLKGETEAIQLLTLLNAFAFYIRVSRGSPSGASASSPKTLSIIQEQAFKPDEYYVWFYEGSQWTTYAGGVLMVVIMLAAVLFPLWPAVLRLGVWYLSMAVLGFIALFFVIAILRLIFYVITIVVAPPGIWVFPKLFADVGFVESFIPLYEWDYPKKKGKKKKGTEKEGGKKSKKNGTASPPTPENGQEEGSPAPTQPTASSTATTHPALGQPRKVGNVTIEEVADDEE